MFLKSKKGQATVEFAMALPVFLLLVLGVFDIAKAAVVRLETQLVLQSFASVAASEQEKTASVLAQTAGNYINRTSMFCTEVRSLNGGSWPGKCQNPVKTTISLESAEGHKSPNAGTQICYSAKSTFKPLYSGVYGDEMVVNSRACTMMETSKKGDSTFMPINSIK